MKKALKNKEVKKLIQQIEKLYGLTYSKKDTFEIDGDLIIINGQASFFYFENRLVPTLILMIEKPVLKKITVDMGAIPFVIKGADIMRPGITIIDENIEKDDFIVIVDEIHEKPLCVGVAFFSGKEINNISSGKVVKNIHWVGDRIWTYN